MDKGDEILKTNGKKFALISVSYKQIAPISKSVSEKSQKRTTYCLATTLL